MPKKTNQELVPVGRPSDYSEDLLDKICEQIQAGFTFREISKMNGMPHFTTLSKWRQTRPEFHYALKATEEDMVRANRKAMSKLADALVDAANTLDDEGALENYAAVKAAIDSLEKVSKVKIVDGPAPTVDMSSDIEDQRQKFNDLHPLTQDRIREALLEDQRLRGEEEE